MGGSDLQKIDVKQWVVQMYGANGVPSKEKLSSITNKQGKAHMLMP